MMRRKSLNRQSLVNGPPAPEPGVGFRTLTPEDRCIVLPQSSAVECDNAAKPVAPLEGGCPERGRSCHRWPATPPSHRGPLRMLPLAALLSGGLLPFGFLPP